MAYRAAVVGGSGYTGAELLRLLAGHPEIEVVHVTADSNAGRPVDRAVSVARRGLPAPRLRGVRAGRGRRGRRRLPRRSRTASRSDWSPSSSAGSPTSSTWPPTSACRPLPTSSGTASAHGAPELLGRFAFGMPELFRAEITPETHVAAPGCYPTASALALAPLLAMGFVEPTGIVVDAASGVSGRGPRALGAQPVLGGERERRRVRPADPPPHG